MRSAARNCTQSVTKYVSGQMEEPAKAVGMELASEEVARALNHISATRQAESLP